MQHEISLAVRILATIKCHKKGNPILSAEIEAMYSISGSKLRDLIRIFRRQGETIANNGGETEGYFYAETWAEYESTYRDLVGRGKSLLETASLSVRRFKIEDTLFAL